MHVAQDHGMCDLDRTKLLQGDHTYDHPLAELSPPPVDGSCPLAWPFA